MKKLLDKIKKFVGKIGVEKFWGGILGAVAIIAAILSLVLGDINASAIAGCVKDVAGTLITVILLFVAIKKLLPKKPGDFDGVFELEMEKIIAKYDPLISRDEDYLSKGKIMYRIVPNFDAIFGEEPQNPVKLFEFDEKHNLKFSVTKTIFVGRNKDRDFDEQSKIISDITKKLCLTFFEKIEKCTNKKDELIVKFKEPMINEDDAIFLAQVIDVVIFYYIAENKK